jgi:hypothetical protein
MQHTSAFSNSCCAGPPVGRWLSPGLIPLGPLECTLPPSSLTTLTSSGVGLIPSQDLPSRSQPLVSSATFFALINHSSRVLVIYTSWVETSPLLYTVAQPLLSMAVSWRKACYNSESRRSSTDSDTAAEFISAMQENGLSLPQAHFVKNWYEKAALDDPVVVFIADHTSYNAYAASTGNHLHDIWPCSQ